MMSRPYVQASIDALVRSHWSSLTELTQYMPNGWREYLGANRGRPFEFISKAMYRDPVAGLHQPTVDPTSPDEVIASALAPRGVERVIVVSRDALLASSTLSHHVARTATAAINDWMIDRWADSARGAYVMAVIQTQLPQEAVREIHRVGAQAAVAGVLLGSNVLGRPLGHPIYHPIYEAAHEHDLPIMFEAGVDAAWTDTGLPPTAGGYPATTAEHLALRAEAAETHIASLIVEGVFDLFPRLRLLVVGAGAAWIPAFVWRLDANYKPLWSEAPWLRRLPSEYFLEHVRIGTDSLERIPTAAALGRVLEAWPGLESVLTYASGYPTVTAMSPEETAERLPAPWRGRILHDNAEALFRWHPPVDIPVPSTVGMTVSDPRNE